MTKYYTKSNINYGRIEERTICEECKKLTGGLCEPCMNKNLRNFHFDCTTIPVSGMGDGKGNFIGIGTITR